MTPFIDTNGVTEPVGIMVTERGCLAMMADCPIKRSGILFVVAFIFLPGCVKHVDLISSFSFSGRTLERQTETPVPGVEIYFVDKGLDYVRSRDPRKGTYFLGKTDENGVFNFDLQYWWGYHKSLFRRKPKGTFEIVIRKDGYEWKEVSYNVNSLERKGHIITVQTGDISLSRKEQLK